MIYDAMSKETLSELLSKEQAAYASFKKERLSLDMTRGRPEKSQLDVALPLLKILAADDAEFKLSNGTDCRNYGGLDGIPEAKELFAELFGVSEDEVLVADNSSLALMYKLVQYGKQFGFGGNAPWNKLPKVKFLCPTPGYDRHFGICKAFGIEMIAVPMDNNGPDMTVVSSMVAADETVKGIWCVPKYSNPTGIVYSDKVVDKLASMPAAAADFRIFWDNSYMVHSLYDTEDKLKNIFDSCKRAGNPDRVFSFTSTSKITFAGGGIAALATSKDNLTEIKAHLQYETIGPNKMNQLAHVRFMKNKDNVKEIMKKHAAILRPKFEMVENMLAPLEEEGIVRFTKPRGGYFISLDVPSGLAKRVVSLAADAGVKLTAAGATYPLGLDDTDSNIRIAPSVPTAQELEKATEVLVCCIRLAVLEKAA